MSAHAQAPAQRRGLETSVNNNASAKRSATCRRAPARRSRSVLVAAGAEGDPAALGATGKVGVEMSEVSYIDSSGIAALVEGLQNARSRASSSAWSASARRSWPCRNSRGWTGCSRSDLVQRTAGPEAQSMNAIAPAGKPRPCDGALAFGIGHGDLFLKSVLPQSAGAAASWCARSPSRCARLASTLPIVVLLAMTIGSCSASSSSPRSVSSARSPGRRRRGQVGHARSARSPRFVAGPSVRRWRAHQPGVSRSRVLDR